MTEGYLESRGIAYRKNDFAEGRPTLLLIHGLSGSCSAWYPYEKILEEKFNLITFDLRGHGLSKRYREYADYELGIMAEDVKALLGHLHIDSYTIVAHSFGTLVAAKLLIEPSKINKAVLLSVPGQTGVAYNLFMSVAFLVVSIGVLLIGILPQLRTSGVRIDYARFRGGSDWDWRRITADVGNTGIRVYLYAFKHSLIYGRNTPWKQNTVSTLVVHGDKDRFSPVTNGIAASKVMPDATLQIIAGANHMLVNNEIQRVAKAITDFIG